jgi:CRP-like cAMP-binding protein
LTYIDRIELFKRSLVFSSLDKNELLELSKLAVERNVKSGEFIFWEGDESDRFYVLAEGRVKAVKHTASGKEFIIAFFSPGEMFGEVAVFEEKPYPATAQALEDSKVFGIKTEDFLVFLSKRPRVALGIINVLAGRLRDAQGRLKDFAGERVEQRLARILLMLSSKLGTELPFTRQEIADMTGTTIETAIRIMSRLTRDGVIRSVRGSITIQDIAQLKHLSEG